MRSGRGLGGHRNERANDRSSDKQRIEFFSRSAYLKRLARIGAQRRFRLRYAGRLGRGGSRRAAARHPAFAGKMAAATGFGLAKSLQWPHLRHCGAEDGQKKPSKAFHETRINLGVIRATINQRQHSLGEFAAAWRQGAVPAASMVFWLRLTGDIRKWLISRNRVEQLFINGFCLLR